jgi:acetylornithine deacetylase/succinyl-diaminopimelate desuccinylase-like protein
VAIESVNPSLVAGGAGEAAIGEYVATWLRRAGFDVRVRDVASGRPNVVAVADGSGDGPTRLLCGHTDTVGVSGMDAPVDPVLRDGRVHGRGAQDMKGGLAAMLDAAASWLAGPRRGSGRIVVAAVADEEYASLGAEALVAEWTADRAVIPEPTDLAIGVAHKGFSCAEVEVLGRAAHGSRPHEGRDAILALGRVLSRLEALDRRLQAGPPDRLLGTASLHAGTIRGGTELSVYPAQAVLQYERRLLPGEPLDAAVKEAEHIIATVSAEDPEFRAVVRPLLARPSSMVSVESPLVQELRACVDARLGPARVDGVTFWTDAAILGAAGIPAVLFGPLGEGLHGAVEYVDVESVAACRDVLHAWLASDDR